MTEQQHDGKLRALKGKDFSAEVSYFDTSPATAMVIIEGGYYTGSAIAATFLDPRQALALRDWLLQEQETLETLAKEIA